MPHAALRRLAPVFGLFGLAILGMLAAVPVRGQGLPRPTIAWQETGNAGATPRTAQRVTGTGESDVVSITGALSGETADLYILFIPNPAQFSATTVNSATVFDTQLSLYNGRGEAVAFNDDALNGNLRSTLPPTDPEAVPPGPGPAQPGLYLLGIASFNSPPLNASGEQIFAPGGFTEVRGPNPTVTDRVLDAFTSNLTSNTYRIDLTGARPVEARVYVDADVPQAGVGGSWASAFASLADALPAARPGDEVWVAEGTYTPGPDRLDAFALPDDVTLLGGFAGTETRAAQRNPAANPTVLSGDLLGNDVPGQDATLSDNAFHVVDATDAGPTAVLDGFFVEGGNADGGGDEAKGGGLFAEDGSPTLRRLVVRRNRARFDGGGLFVEDGTPVVEDVRFEDNVARNGGGAFFEGSIVTAEALVFARNDATRDGGGLYLDESDVALPTAPGAATLTFTQNVAERGGGLFARRVLDDLPGLTLTGNIARADGGGLYLDESSPRLDALAAFGNDAQGRGGGLFASSNSDPVLVYGRFSGNTALATGGGVHASFLSSPRLVHTTLAGNAAGLGGAGVAATDNSAPVVANSVVWGNRTGSGAPSALDADATSTFDVQHAVVEGGFAGGTVVLDADPRFADADGPDDTPGTPDDDLRLTLGSSAVETGANDLDLDGPTGPAPTTAADLAADLDGQPRRFRAAFPGAAVDLGPYELQAVQATVATPTVDGATGFFDLGATGLTINLTRNASPAGTLQAQTLARRARGTGVPPNTPPFHWQIRSTAFTDSLAYNLTFDLGGVPDVPNPDELMAYATDVAINPGGFFPTNTAWTDVSTLPGVDVSIDVANARLTVTGLQGDVGTFYRSFTVGGGNNPLPVTLTAFEAVPEGDGVRLVWATASETQNAGFAVEHRAPTAEAFAEVAFVDGAGTTAAPQRYALRVPELGAGTHRFRLRQVDFDGTATPSDEVEARLALDAPAALSAFPSPFRQRASVVATVREAQRVTITVHDLLGRTVATLHDGPLAASTPRTLTLNGQGLASGVYLVRLTGTRGAAATRRLVRLR